MAWAAGLFEGEGTTYAQRERHLIRMRLQISSTDRDVLERFVAVLRANGVRCPRLTKRGNRRPLSTKDIYEWKVSGEAAITAYELLRPWLGSRRRSKADGLIEQVRASEQARAAELAVERPCAGGCGRRVSGTKKYCSKDCYSRHRWSRGLTPHERERAREHERRRYHAKRRPGPDQLGLF